MCLFSPWLDGRTAVRRRPPPFPADRHVIRCAGSSSLELGPIISCGVCTRFCTGVIVLVTVLQMSSMGEQEGLNDLAFRRTPAQTCYHLGQDSEDGRVKTKRVTLNRQPRPMPPLKSDSSCSSGLDTQYFIRVALPNIANGHVTTCTFIGAYPHLDLFSS